MTLAIFFKPSHNCELVWSKSKSLKIIYQCAITTYYKKVMETFVDVQASSIVIFIERCNEECN